MTPDAAVASIRPQVDTRRLLLLANAAALLIAALVLRGWRLDSIPGINGDEAWSGVQALRLLHGESVDWRTPNGNPLNPFFFLPLVVLHAIAPPSFLLLRGVALASGLAALVANYFLCRRAFDAHTAAISTILLALLPIDIAYSRFAWDASQSLLATLFVLYLPLVQCRARGAAATVPMTGVAALAAAILIHPTNVFAAPLLVAPAVYVRRRQIVHVLQTTAISAGTWRLAGLVTASAAAAYVLWIALVQMAGRAHGPAELPAFALNYLRLFSGTTIYEFIAGLDAGASDQGTFVYVPMACDLAMGAIALVALWGLVRRLRHHGDACDVALVIGWLAMLAGFFVVAGPGAIAPHHERYGICLIGPGALVMSRGLAWWTDRQCAQGRAAAAALAIVAWLGPVSFSLGYVEFIRQTGGRSHDTFRTAETEPKWQTFHAILAQRQPDERVSVVCHDWWNYWPLAYLAQGENNVQVLQWDAWHGASKHPLPEDGDTWFVEFAGSAGEREALDCLEKAKANFERQMICDFAGRGVISLLGPVRNFSKNN